MLLSLMFHIWDNYSTVYSNESDIFHVIVGLTDNRVLA